MPGIQLEIIAPSTVIRQLILKCPDGGRVGTMAKTSGKALAKEYGLEVEHALYRRSGDWYHILKAFPGALFDANGYLVFVSQGAYDAFASQGPEQGVVQYLDTNTLTIRGGISRHKDYVRFLEALLFLDEESAGGLVTEGAQFRVNINAYERNASARRRSIQKWGLDCTVCGFNFQRAYGELGADFIHVHHLVPISAAGTEYKLNPESDLRPVCANCHAMLHQKNPPILIEELRERLSKTK